MLCFEFPHARRGLKIISETRFNISREVRIWSAVVGKKTKKNERANEKTILLWNKRNPIRTVSQSQTAELHKQSKEAKWLWMIWISLAAVEKEVFDKRENNRSCNLFWRAPIIGKAAYRAAAKQGRNFFNCLRTRKALFHYDFNIFLFFSANSFWLKSVPCLRTCSPILVITEIARKIEAYSSWIKVT